MTDAGRTPVGDFLRAARTLQASADATVARLASMLGVAWEASEERESEVVPVRAPTPATTAYVLEAEPGRVVIQTELRVDPAAAVIPATLIPLPAETIVTPPEWVKEVEPLEPAASAAPPAEPLPLLRPAQYRGILSTLLSTTGEHGPMNVQQIVRTIARGDAIRRIPRRPTSTLAHGIQLLLDGGETMAAFGADITRLEGDIARLCGEAALDVVDFARSPLRGAGRRSEEEWRPYGGAERVSGTDERSLLPPPGTRVVCVTDLGIARGPGIARIAPGEWLEFARMVRQAGCPVVFLVPYGPRRWPPALRRSLSIVHWDPATTAAAVARAVRGRHWRRRSSW